MARRAQAGVGEKAARRMVCEAFSFSEPEKSQVYLYSELPYTPSSATSPRLTASHSNSEVKRGRVQVQAVSPINFLHLCALKQPSWRPPRVAKGSQHPGRCMGLSLSP